MGIARGFPSQRNAYGENMSWCNAKSMSMSWRDHGYVHNRLQIYAELLYFNQSKLVISVYRTTEAGTNGRHFQMHFVEKMFSFWCWKVCPGIHLTTYKHWYGQWSGANQVAYHYVNQREFNCLLQICATRCVTLIWWYSFALWSRDAHTISSLALCLLKRGAHAWPRS